MQNDYTITVTNKFSLALDEDEDPLEVLKNREKEKEAKKKEKLSEKENKSKQSEAPKATGNKTQKSRVIKDAQQPASKTQDLKKEQGEKKLSQQRPPTDRSVKFSGESREEHNNRRNREDGERPSRGQGDVRRGPPGNKIPYYNENRGEGREGREPREGREGRDGRDGRESRETREFRKPEQRGDFGERRGRGGMRGMGRGSRGGPRGGRSFDNRGKREFDRQSGSDKTGIKPVDKKDGAGSHNWGTHNDEIEESLNQENQDWSNDKVDTDTTHAPSEGKEGDAPADTSTEEKAAEEEARELTLDDWKKERESRVKPQYNLRKAGEGEDLSRWKKMYPLERKKEGENETEEEGEYDAGAYPQRAGRQKRVDIEINFADNRRGAGGRGRGGRGGRGDRANGRGYGNRGAPRDGDNRGLIAPQAEQRSPRGRQNAPKVDDEHDFPSLG
ncbi:SERPINE1 mRNA-binding protein 1-like [Prorops nasuta]|uniref:SERPINE1 mRNA-binding protein 1-like n=1 Tax=Prorops nasuta TaxID=863751 RepID=UPI0034D02187